MKKETESVLTAAQDQALRTNYIRNMTDKQDVLPMCRLCGKREETVSHITTKCKKLDQKQLIKNLGHDQVAKVVHWKLPKLRSVVQRNLVRSFSRGSDGK